MPLRPFFFRILRKFLSAKAAEMLVAGFIISQSFCLRPRRPYSPTTGCHLFSGIFQASVPVQNHRSVFHVCLFLLKKRTSGEIPPMDRDKSYGFLCTPLRLRTNHPYDNQLFRDHAGERAVPNVS